MITYLIKFILCSGFLYSFYKLILERESMYKINRFYLLFSLIFALIAPFYKIEVPITAQETQISPELLAYLMQNPDLMDQQSGFNIGDILNIIYIIIGLILFIRFSFNFYELMFKVKTEEKIKDKEITYILDLDSVQPYSFWNYIFIPKKQINQLHQNLIDHEKAHCVQKHSFDIVLIEIFQIIFWFNPFLYFYKKSIKLNHEFLADEYVLQRNADLKMYQHQILDCIASQNPSQMASNFNFILTKKRLLMMTKNTSSRKVKLLSFASLPFIFSAFVLFSQKSFAQEVEKSANKVEKALEQPIKPQADLIFGTKEENKITKELKDSISLIKNLSVGKTMTKEELKDILKKNPTNRIILNDAGEIILNDTIKIKDIVTQKELIPTTLYDTKGDVLKSIDPKYIDKIVVNKKEGFIEVTKKDSTKIKIFTKDLPKAKTYTIEKSMPLTLNGIDYKSVTLKDGYAIYTDKNGIEHKILNSEIEEVYLNKKGQKEKVLTLGSFSINPSKELSSTKEIINKNPWEIKVEAHKKDASLLAKNKTIKSIEIEDPTPERIKKVNDFTVKYFYSEEPQKLAELLENRKNELKLQEENTKKMIKNIEKQQRELKRND